MNAKRVIPCLDVKDGRVVKGMSFIGLQDAGDPVECARLYEQMGADELVLLDIMATYEGRGTILGIVRDVSSQINIPLAVGGGIRSADDFASLLEAGASKVGVNSAAVRKPEIIREAAERFGSGCVVLAVDARRINDSCAEDSGHKTETPPDVPASCLLDENSKYEVYLDGGRTPTGIDPVRWSAYGAQLGAGEILLTSMDRDGRKDGYELDLTRAVSEAVGVPVIASGGAGELSHFYDAVTEGKADAVLAASLFHFGELSVSQVKEYLRERGVAVGMTA